MNALRHYWHPVLWSKEVADKPVPAKLLAQPLVIWRANGNLSVFYDLCIHRGAALSLGWVNGDRLVCGYHGWNYAGDGSCTHIPSLPPDRWRSRSCSPSGSPVACRRPTLQTG